MKGRAATPAAPRRNPRRAMVARAVPALTSFGIGKLPLVVRPAGPDLMRRSCMRHAAFLHAPQWQGNAAHQSAVYPPGWFPRPVCGILINPTQAAAMFDKLPLSGLDLNAPLTVPLWWAGAAAGLLVLLLLVALFRG